MTLPVLPDPERNSYVEVYTRCQAIVNWAYECEDADLVNDAKLKMEAIALYLKKKEGAGEAAKAVRLLEIRIGELLPPEPPQFRGNQHAVVVPTDAGNHQPKISPNRAVEYRKMADPANAPAVKAALETSTDDKPVTKAAILTAIDELNKVKAPKTKTPELKLKFLIDLHMDDLYRINTNDIPDGLPIEVLESLDVEGRYTEIIRQARYHINRLEKIINRDSTY